MDTTSGKISDTNSQADFDSPVTFPAWYVQGWAGERSRIKPADADELALARELIDSARMRGITISLSDLGVRCEDDLTLAANTGETPSPVFGTIEDKVVKGVSASIDPAALGVNGLAYNNQQIQLPPTAGATS